MTGLWHWWGDGERSRAFACQIDAANDAAEHFGLSEDELNVLLADGFLPLGKFSGVKVCDANDCSI